MILAFDTEVIYIWKYDWECKNMQCPTDCHESLYYVISMLCVHKIMDSNPTDVKLDMLRSKTSYWYNEMYVKINIAFGIIRWMILKQNPTWCA